MLINFFSAFALVLVFEGLMPFASPQYWRSLLLKIIAQDDKRLRLIGLFCMLAGVLLLSVVHQFVE